MGSKRFISKQLAFSEIVLNLVHFALPRDWKISSVWMTTTDEIYWNCGGQKDNFPLTFLSSLDWANNQVNVRQINRKKCPKCVTDVHVGAP